MRNPWFALAGLFSLLSVVFYAQREKLQVPSQPSLSYSQPERGAPRPEPPPQSREQLPSVVQPEPEQIPVTIQPEEPPQIPSGQIATGSQRTANEPTASPATEDENLVLKGLKVIEPIFAGQPAPVPQTPSQPTYQPQRKKVEFSGPDNRGPIKF